MPPLGDRLPVLDTEDLRIAEYPDQCDGQGTHAKSRLGGRAVTDVRREGAAVRLVQVLERDFDEKHFILLGDFNDTPDDRSLNILETRDPDAPGPAEDEPGLFLINLTEPLYAAGHVTLGGLVANAGVGRRI